MQPLISICIPAYQRLPYLQRLLDSITDQVFKDIEVIITDDSPDDLIEAWLRGRTYSFPLHYHRNATALGTPANWAQAMQQAKGSWIKLMHDDDWFTDRYALETFAAHLDESADVLFCGYWAYFEDRQKKLDRTLSQRAFQRIRRDPYSLLANNLLGPPSVVLFRRNMQERYDPRIKWIVDWEAYVRMIKRYTTRYISLPLVTMSYNDTQVTRDCFRKPEVEIPEALYYYQKHGLPTIGSWTSYDGWWRLIRNLGIRDAAQLHAHAGSFKVPSFLLRIVSMQRRIAPGLLKIGVFSKLCMTLSYYVNR